MGELISLKEWAEKDAEYQAVRSVLVADLEFLLERLRDGAVQLAFAGPWREWSDAVPVGTVVEISEESLVQAGDGNIRALMALANAIEDALEEMGAKGGEE